MRLSIITVTFKDLSGLKRTLKSVTDQSFKDFECLIIDGGSGPEVVQFLDGIKDPRISWVSEKDNGVFDAMNKGIEKATGDWLMFLNGGDSIYSPSTLEEIAPTLCPVHDLVYGDYLWEYGDRPSYLKRAKGHQYIYYGMFSCHQAMFFRKGFVSDIRYDTKYRIAGDYAYLCRIKKLKAKCMRVEIPVCRFDMNGISNQMQEVGRSEYSNIQRQILGVPLCITTCIRYMHFLSTSARKIADKFTVKN